MSTLLLVHHPLGQVPPLPPGAPHQHHLVHGLVEQDHSEGGNTTLVLLEVVNHIPDDVHVVTEEWNIWENLEREVLERESFLYRAGLVLLKLVQVRPIGLLKLETNSGPVTLAALGIIKRNRDAKESSSSAGTSCLSFFSILTPAWAQPCMSNELTTLR